MIKSREDLIMMTGPIMIGGGRHPMIERCALCGGGADNVADGKIVHGTTCVLVSDKVTHVRMIGCVLTPAESKPEPEQKQKLGWKQRILRKVT